MYQSIVIIQEYINLFEISRNTAVSDLNYLVDINYLDKQKKGRTVYYKLKLD